MLTRVREVVSSYEVASLFGSPQHQLGMSYFGVALTSFGICKIGDEVTKRSIASLQVSSSSSPRVFV